MAENNLTERKLAEVLRVLGWTIPQTEAEVEQWEEEFDEDAVELSDELADPFAALDKSRRRKAARGAEVQDFPVDKHFQNGLAQAAREGKKIPPEIEARMKSDRIRAEAEKRQREGDDT
jgi:hypothetical protein